MPSTPIYTATSTLPEALRLWSRRRLNSIPPDRAPCGHLPALQCEEENRTLSRIFVQLCATSSTTDRLAFLASAIIAHERRLELAWNAGHRESDPQRVGAMDRSTWSRLKPYEAMIGVLCLWMDEMHDAALAEVGVLLIDDGARSKPTARQPALNTEN
jgi:hypothetical protein